MIQKLIINAELTDLNTYIDAERRNKFAAAKIKKDNTELVEWYSKKLKKINNPVEIEFNWYCKNKRKDPDNIAFAKKFILDGLVNAGVLKNDGFSDILRFNDNFYVDKDNPRVEVLLCEKE